MSLIDEDEEDKVDDEENVSLNSDLIENEQDKSIKAEVGKFSYSAFELTPWTSF